MAKDPRYSWTEMANPVLRRQVISIYKGKHNTAWDLFNLSNVYLQGIFLDSYFLYTDIRRVQSF